MTTTNRTRAMIGLLSALALAAIAGCSDDDVKKDSGPAADASVKKDLGPGGDLNVGGDQKAGGDINTGGDVKVSPDGPVTTELEGTWNGACEMDSEGDDRRVTLVLSGLTQVHVTTSHSSTDLSCKPAAATLLRNFRSTFTIGAASTAVAGAKEIDHVIVSMGYTPITAAAVTYLNSQKFCGQTDWALNKEKIFTTTPCEPGWPTAGTQVLDIFKISPDGKTLQLGGGSTTKRPTKLAPTVYTKK